MGPPMRVLGPLALGSILALLAGCGGAPSGSRLADRSTDASRARSVPARAALGKHNTLRPRAVFGEARPPFVSEEGTALFSPDDAVLALGEADGLIRFFDAESGAPLEALRAHEVGITLLAAAPGGGFVSGDAAGELALHVAGPSGFLDATTELLASRHRAAITSVSFSSDGSVMVTADRDGNALAWDVKNRKVTAQLDESEDSGDGVTVGRGRASRYAVSREGKAALGYGASSFFVLTLADKKAGPTHRPRGTIVGARAEGAGFAVDIEDKWGATKRLVLDASGNTTSTTLVAPPDTEPFGEGVLGHDAKAYFFGPAGDAARRVRVDLEPDEARSTFIVSASGKRAYLANGDGVALLDGATRRARVLRTERGELSWPTSIVELSGEVAVSDGGAVHFYDATSSAARGTIPLPVTTLARSPDGKHLGGWAGRAFAMDIQSRELVYDIDLPDLGALSPDFSRGARRDADKIVFFDPSLPTAQGARFDLGSRYPTLLAFSPDGRSLLVGDGNGQVDRVDSTTGKLLGSAKLSRQLTTLVSWDASRIFAAAKNAGGSLSLVELDAASLALRGDTPAGPELARSKTGAWSAFLTKDGVRLKHGGKSFMLPDRLGRATTLAFDSTEKVLYVGRLGAVEQWSLDEIAASSAAETLAEVKVQTPPTPGGPPKVDTFGDPLPAHALRRFGTERWHTGAEIEDIFVAGDRTWIITSWGRALEWDWTKGVATRRIESEGSAGDRTTFLTPDEAWVVSRGVLSIGLWSGKTGTAGKKIERKDGKDECSALSPKGDRFAVATETGELMTFAIPGLGVLQSTQAHKGRIEALAFSPDGKTLAWCGRFGTLTIADAATLKPKRTVLGRSTDEYAGCSSIAFSVDGRTLFTDLGGIGAYDVATGKRAGDLSGDAGNVSQIATSRDGLVAVGHHHEGVTIFKGETRAKLRSLDVPGGGAAVAFSTDGKRLLVGGADGIPRAFDTTSWAEIDARPVHGQLESLALASGGQVLVSADRSGQLRAWDAATGAMVASRVVESYPSLVTTDTGLYLAAKGLRRIDPRTLRDVDSPVDVSGGGLAVAKNGALAALISGHELNLVELPAGKTRAVAWGGGYVDAVAVDPSGRVVAAGGTNGAVRFFSPDGTELGGGRAGVPVESIVFAPNESAVFVAARREGSSPVYVCLEVPSGKQRWRLDELAFSSSDRLAVSADGKILAFEDHEGVALLDAKTGARIGAIPHESTSWVTGLVFSPDRKTLFVNQDRTVIAWDTSFLR